MPLALILIKFSFRFQSSRVISRPRSLIIRTISLISFGPTFRKKKSRKGGASVWSDLYFYITSVSLSLSLVVRGRVKCEDFTENVYRSNFCFDGGATRGGGAWWWNGKGVERKRMRVVERGRRRVGKADREADVITAGNWTNGKCILLLCQPSPKRRAGIASSLFISFSLFLCGHIHRRDLLTKSRRA